MKVMAEYIWVDGTKPTTQLRSKTKILSIQDGMTLDSFQPPVWGFDGSSTEQAAGHASDCVLQPIKTFLDPIRTQSSQRFPHLLVLCEVYLANGEPHPTNTRALLRATAKRLASEEFWFGIEQEYTFFKEGRPLGFPKEGYPAPQGPYYCGVGAQNIYGREIVEEHMNACLTANILFAGINAEVMPGQWEFQIGTGGPLDVADDLVVARWLLHRMSEEYDVVVSFDCKPAQGDWNGAGAHTNFSTKAMRESSSAFTLVLEKLRDNKEAHIAVYGDGVKERLTGAHETCDYKTFRYGVSDRGASVRIPWHVNKAGKGYLEDRRPGANCDPYLVLEILMRTIGSSGNSSTIGRDLPPTMHQTNAPPQPRRF
ncbi:TPA: glutamine synthetase [Candidatus Woesearchaeota archaeon]|nr:glutamine synthetase [Candidatus Woesearchaeota archaeon]